MKILLVHEDEGMLHHIEQMIMVYYPDGEIEIFSSAKDALCEINNQESRIDICFAKVQTSEVSGFRIAEEVRKYNRMAKIVFIASDDRFALDGWRFGMNDYLIEPLTEDSIRHTLISCASEVS
ncbi:MAG: response regulator [Lachnospiraceae bacterium]|nr:response regulator [Lachnospiraceae bacterium]